MNEHKISVWRDDNSDISLEIKQNMLSIEGKSIDISSFEFIQITSKDFLKKKGNKPFIEKLKENNYTFLELDNHVLMMKPSKNVTVTTLDDVQVNQEDFDRETMEARLE